MTALNRLQLIGNVGAEPKVTMSKQNTEFLTKYFRPDFLKVFYAAQQEILGLTIKVSLA